MNHYKLLCDFGELNWIFTDSGDIDSFLYKIVSLVIRHIDSDGCSIFLYDEESNQLILRAFAGSEESRNDEEKCLKQPILIQYSLLVQVPLLLARPVSLTIPVLKPVRL